MENCLWLPLRIKAPLKSKSRQPEEVPVFDHIIPLNDLKPHVSERFCECMPYADAECPTVIIHNAYDGRELKERFRKLGYQNI